LEESDGTYFLVLELIEGDTLADRIKSGPIPVEESLKLALQIAEALEAAHEKGVIHRDLKPANIKVTPDDKVKVLDIVLAKAFSGESEDMNLSSSPTLSVAATQQRIIPGTAAYMSPEQASGKAVDKRTDIGAFDVVLFEILTGRSLFGGNNVSQTLASVIKSEPEWKSLPSNLHPRIHLLIEADGEQVHRPQVLPGGEWVLFTITSATGSNRWDEARIVVQSLKTGERRLLVSGGSDVPYVPTGHIVYAPRNSLFAIAFDLDSLKVNGQSRLLVSGVKRAVNTTNNTGTANFSISDTGPLVYIIGSVDSTENCILA
jgi:serine/threonine protein kinase